MPLPPCPHPGKLLGQRERRAPLLVLEGAETHGLRHSPHPFHSRRPSSALLPPHMDPPFLPEAAFEVCSFIPLFFQHPYVEQPSGAREQGGRAESIQEIQVLNSRVDATKPCRSTPSGILENRGYCRGAQKRDKNCPREVGRETGRESSTVKARKLEARGVFGKQPDTEVDLTSAVWRRYTGMSSLSSTPLRGRPPDRPSPSHLYPCTTTPAPAASNSSKHLDL